MEQQKYKGQVIQVEILQPSGAGHWTGKRRFNTTTVGHLDFLTWKGYLKNSILGMKPNSTSLKRQRN